MKKILLCVIAHLLVGCGYSFQFLSTNRPPQPLTAQEPSSVELFTTGMPRDKFVEVGIIDAGPRSGLTVGSDLELLQKLREYGAEKGCNALVLIGEKTNYYSSSSGTTTGLNNYQVACIVWDKTS